MKINPLKADVTPLRERAAPTPPRRWLGALAHCIEQTECRTADGSVSLEAGLDALAELWAGQRRKDGAVHWAGNGGSSTIAGHLSQDLLNRGGVRSLTFNDPALLTCMANDYGYADVFQRPLAAIARTGEALMAISSSGMSENIIAAASQALDMGLELVTFSAFGADNRLRQLPAALSFFVPTHTYGQAELAHGALLHAALDWLEGIHPK